MLTTINLEKKNPPLIGCTISGTIFAVVRTAVFRFDKVRFPWGCTLR